MALKWNSETLKQYPFKFEVHLTYKINPGEILCEQRVVNLDQKSMPYSFGFHPYLSIPHNASKKTTQINFSHQSRLLYNNDYTDLIGQAPPLELPTQLENSSLYQSLFLLKKNKSVTLKFEDQLTLSLETSGEQDTDMYKYLQLYSLPEKPFICVEPWTSFPNAMNSINAMRLLPPTKQDKGFFSLTLNKNQ